MPRSEPSPLCKRLEGLPAHAQFFLVGVGGCGMSGLAHWLLDLGFDVAGSDLFENEEIGQLRQRGAAIHVGHSAHFVRSKPPALLVYSSAIRPDNPERAEARRLGIPEVRRAALLSALMEAGQGICVTGMHGKTTTTALLAFALERLGACPAYAIGGRLPAAERHARYLSACAGGGGRALAACREAADQTPPNWILAETDESDGTLNLFHPRHALVLNVDEEHLDHFGDLEAVCREFGKFAGSVPGRVIFNADDAALRDLLRDHPGGVSFGFHPEADYRIREYGDASHGRLGLWFSLDYQGRSLGTFAVGLLGRQNAANAAAVVALLHQLGYPAAALSGVMASFRGVARRQEELYRDDAFRVFDDYGHHPFEIEATLKALKGLGQRRLLVAFQPHRFTRTERLIHRFATCFRQADVLWVNEVYAASESPIPGVSGRILVDAIQAKGLPAVWAPSLPDLPRLIREAMQPGDLILFLGAGDITRAAHEFASQLKQKREATLAALQGELCSVLSSATLCRREEPLAKRTTLRVGGKADFFLEPATEGDLASALRFCAMRELPVIFLGRGSNLLVLDGGVRGVVISLGHPVFSRIEVVGNRIHCGCGARLKAVAAAAKRHGLAGLEFMEGIPGSVGGALRMNAGCMGSCISDRLVQVSFLDREGRRGQMPGEELPAEYRHCSFFETHVAIQAVFEGWSETPEAVERRMRQFSEKRWKSQPAAASAGCIFKNPAGIAAGRLVEELGMKGFRIGDAVVSDRHGNFIVNAGHATAGDVLAIIDLIQQRSVKVRGIDLQTEVQIIGSDAASPVCALPKGGAL